MTKFGAVGEHMKNFAQTLACRRAYVRTAARNKLRQKNCARLKGPCVSAEGLAATRSLTLGAGDDYNVCSHKSAPNVCSHKSAPIVCSHKSAPNVCSHKSAPKTTGDGRTSAVRTAFQRDNPIGKLRNRSP